MADCIARCPTPRAGSDTLGDNLVITITGDTPKDALTSSGWPDSTAKNHNLLYVMGNGYLEDGSGSGTWGRTAPSTDVGPQHRWPGDDDERAARNVRRLGRGVRHREGGPATGPGLQRNCAPGGDRSADVVRARDANL